MAEESFTYEFRTILFLVAHLREALCSKGTGPFGIPHLWCGGTSVIVTAHWAEIPRALHQKPVLIGRSYHRGSLGLEPKLLWRTGVGT